MKLGNFGPMLTLESSLMLTGRICPMAVRPYHSVSLFLLTARTIVTSGRKIPNISVLKFPTYSLPTRGSLRIG